MLTPTNRRVQVKTSLKVILVVTIPALLLFAFFPIVRQCDFPNYLFWHTAVQAISIVMAAQIFTLVLSAYKRSLPTNIVVLGIICLAIAFLDFSHLLLHPGMPMFFDAYYQHESFYFWLIIRLLIAFSLFFISIYPWSRRFPSQYFFLGILFLITFLVLINALVFYFPSLLPNLFGAQEKTQFINLVIGAILLSLLAIASGRLFIQTKNSYPKNICRFFTAAILFFIYELISTFHPEQARLYHIISDIYKLTALYFLYRAVFSEVVLYPYEQLKNSQQQLQATLKASPDLIFEIDEKGAFHTVYNREDTPSVLAAHDLLGQSIEQVFNPDSAEIALQGLKEAQQQGIAQNKIVSIHSPVTEEPAWLELSISHLQTDNEQLDRFIAIARNITTRVKENEQLKLLSEAVEHNPSAIYILDKHLQIQFVNKTFTKLTGYEPQEALGHTLDLFTTQQSIQELRQHLRHQINTEKVWQDEVQRIRKNNKPYLAEISIYPILDGEGQLINYLVIENDITETRRMTEKLQRISNFDRLTGLPNHERLQMQLEHLKTTQNSIAVLWINLDHFKNINDALGYQVGNQLLKEVADRLSNLLRPQDILARPNGDNFVMLLPAVQHEAAAAMAQKVFETLASPLQTINRALVISASIGISMYPWDSKNSSTLLTQAETAMYRVKKDARGNYCFFELEMHEKNAQNMAIGMALKQAIQNQEFFLVYQPQIDLKTGQVLGVEALIRWKSPFWGTISPATFIPLAEESGDIAAIGQWIISAAIQQVKSWRKMKLPITKVAINISAVQFEQADFYKYLSAQLEKHGVSANHLELELTEAVAMRNPNYFATRIEKLKAAQIKIAIDDFGTGYSSLNYLKRFNIDTIKIDQSFVRAIHQSPEDQAIVNAIITMAHHLGLKTIAEGVESKEELDFLRSSGCHAAQGFYFAQPLMTKDLEKFLMLYEYENFL